MYVVNHAEKPCNVYEGVYNGVENMYILHIVIRNAMM